MLPLVSQREYDLNFADPASSPGVSLFYLKLTDSSLRALEQVLRTLNSSRTPAPPPLKLEMGEGLSGTLTIPQVRGDDTPQSSDGCRFSISLAPQEISMDLLHTLTTYPTHEERSLPPGTRRASMGTPPDPDVFLHLQGPITHRLNIKATTNESFAWTSEQFRQIKRKIENSGIRQLSSQPGEGAIRRNKFDFKGKHSYKQPFPSRPHPSRGPILKRTPFSNGTLSPTPAPDPPRPRQAMSPPSAPKERPAPSKKPSPAQRKRPPESLSPVPPDAPPVPSPKRAKKESPRKWHRSHRAASDGILSEDTLAEISRFRELGCAWPDLYPDITSPEIRAEYRSTYDRDFSCYQRLREAVEAGIGKMTEYLAQLNHLSRESPEHRHLKRHATRLCEENRDLRAKFSYLHEKLSVVKRQIELFDKSH